jgi:hypothetical protein
MPMTSILAALGIMLLGKSSFGAAQMGFIIITSLVPVVTGALAYSFTHRKISAFLAGSLAALSGFYAPFMVTTDSFGIYALLGGLIMLILDLHSKEESHRTRNLRFLGFIILGLITGIMYLTRSDGLLWFAVFVAVILVDLMKETRLTDSAQPAYQAGHWSRIRWIVADLLFFISGCFLIIAPWVFRNLRVFNALLSPGGWRILWLTSYDEIFTYPASDLTLTNWLESGLSNIVQARVWALGQNLQTSLAVQGMIFLLPLILVGMWEFRQDLRVRIGAFIWFLLLFLMTFILPFVGARGGFFHAGAALIPLFLAMVPIGLEKFIQWGVRIRDWEPEKARIGFSILLVLSALLFSTSIVYIRVKGNTSGEIVWGKSEEFYLRIDQHLLAYGIQPEEIILVNNPPGYIVATGRTAIAIPDGDEKTLIDVAKRYHATYMILESNHPQGLRQLYFSPLDRGLIMYLGTYENAHIFKIG